MAADFNDETYKNTTAQKTGFGPLSGSKTFNFVDMFKGHMDDEEMPDMGRGLLEGGELCFSYEGKDRALDLLYDLFENGVYERSHFACLYPIGVDKDPVEADSPEELSREQLHELMGPGGLGMCLLGGYGDDGNMLPYAVFWSSYEDSEPEMLTLASTDSGPYPDLGWLLAFMLNAGHVLNTL